MRMFFIFLLAFIFVTSTSAQKQMSDREADGLKGKVKSVTTESARLQNQAGRWIEEKRLPDSIVSYDLAGNRIKQELFDYKGNLSQTSIYSFIDGRKVAKQERFYDKNNPPIMVVNPSQAKESKVRDSRYSYKFEYKFDDKGRRNEEAWYSNDGSLWIRDVSRYDENGNKIEWIRYTKDNTVSFRSTSEFDAKGNEVGKTWFSADGSISSKLSFTYEFDTNGNWIKRNTQKWVTQNGKSFFEPHEITYRQITYF